MAKRLLSFASVALLVAALPVHAQIAQVRTSKAQSFGTVENGVYHNNLTSIQFTLPPEWVIVRQAWASGGAQAVMLRDTVLNEIATVWLKARVADPADIPAEMNSRLDARLAQRNNFEGYKYRSESVRHTIIGGQPALSAVADYVRTGQKMVEYVTWIDGEKSRVVFAARLPASGLAEFQSRFDPIIQSAEVP